MRLKAWILVCVFLCVPISVEAAKRRSQPVYPASPEKPLAESGRLYLLVDQRAKVAQIKVRGIVLEVLPLQSLRFLDYQTTLHDRVERRVQLPALFTVEEDAASTYRLYIAPSTLISVKEAERLEAEKAAAKAAASDQAKPRKKEETKEPVRPSSFQVQLADGWALDIMNETPGESLWSHLKIAFHEGLAHFHGVDEKKPRLLSMTVSVDDARRVHRLMHPGFQILVIG
jgi:hypothetical protein